jgi:thiamine biosynthesis lipoprotein
MSIATSGTYNQFFEIDKFEYSHIFDSRLGKPVKNNIISVSVITTKSIDSDALATSLKVIGVKKGLELINNIENTESLFITKENGDFKSYYSKNFLSFVID